MARPPKPDDEKFDAAVRLRMREQDKELVDEAARLAGLSTSGWTRDRLLKAARAELRKAGGA